MKKRISGAGCCLLDYLYRDCSFDSETFIKYCSLKAGDGGLIPGNLVFAEDLAGFAGKDEDSILHELTSGAVPDAVNLGGPGIVPMVHAAQLLKDWNCSFYGVINHSDDFNFLKSFIEKFSLSYKGIESEGAHPSSSVLSDPSYNNSAGERTFINRLGAAAAFNPELLNDEFYSSDIVLWGGTALVPPLHEVLGSLCRKVHERGGLNIVGTVYDFKNESAAPDKPWPLGHSDEPAYPFIDLLICDYEEALRLSGEDNLDSVMDFFINSGIRACIITRGKEDVLLFAENSHVFESCSLYSLPVSPFVDSDLKKHPDNRGDTTGCGDNFMGGVLVSIARQLETSSSIDLQKAAVEGIAAGGLALYTMGGCFNEIYPGEKEERLSTIREDYIKNTLPGINSRPEGESE